MPPHAECFRRKYEARDAVIDEVAWLVQECFRGFYSKKHVARNVVEKNNA